jgi:hypothetical protein
LNQTSDFALALVQGPNNSLSSYWNTIGQPWAGPSSIAGANSTYGITGQAAYNSLSMDVALVQGPTNSLDNYWVTLGQPWNGPVVVAGAGSVFDPQPPFIDSGATATFSVGSLESVTVTASGPPAPTLSQTGQLPGGVTFIDNGDGTATLAGTPAPGTSGTYPITITATNGIAPDATQSFRLTVLPMGITTTSLPSGVLKTAYSATLAATGGNPPYKWSLASGSSSLPPGLKLKSTGVILGKPKTAGTYPFTVQVVDTKTKIKPKTQNKSTVTLSITIS